MTIGSVVDRLKGEFPDISVSKLRYLEEQGLVTPRRTKSRLPPLLAGRLQPPRARAHHAARRVPAAQGDPPRARAQPGRRRAGRAAGAAQGRLRRPRGGARATPPRRSCSSRAPTRACSTNSRSTSCVHRAARSAACGATARPTCGIVGAAAQLAVNGLRPKNLRLVKSSIDREHGPHRAGAAAGAQVAAPGAPPRGLDQLEDIVQATTQLRQLLLTRGIRRLTAGPATRLSRAGRARRRPEPRDTLPQQAGRTDRGDDDERRPDRPRRQDARDPGLSRRRASSFATSCRCSRTRRRCARPSTASSSTASAGTSTSCSAPRRAGSSSAPPSPTGSAPASSARASPASSRTTTVSSRVRPRVRHRQARGPRRRHQARPERPRPRRPPGHGRHGTRQGRARREARRQGRRPRLPRRARRPQGARQARRLRRLQPDHVLNLASRRFASAALLPR